MAGIALTSYTYEVMAQSDLEKASTASNGTVNATATAMEGANEILKAASNATEKGLKTYENGKYGLSFPYPSEWGEIIDLGCEDPTQTTCGPNFPFLLFQDTNSNNKQGAWALSNKTTFDLSLDADRKLLDTSSQKQDINFYAVGASVIDLDKPSVSALPCNCSTLKDFITWDYIRGENKNRTFINDNQTVLGKNYSAWQTEIDFESSRKYLNLYTVNGNLGYKFSYIGPSGDEFDKYLGEFRNMLKTVEITTPTPEKKPSFLNSSQINNLSGLPSTNTTHDKSVKILSSNDFVDTIGYMHVVGEVQNNTPTNAQFVQVTGTFYDSNNQVVGTQFTYTSPSDIGPGQKAPFEIILMSASVPNSPIDHYNLVTCYQ